MSQIIAFLIACQVAIQDPFPATVKAMMIVESDGDPEAVGDGGRAIGILQIHKCYWEDSMRFLGQMWPYSDARDPVKAAMAVRSYTERYAKHYKQPWTAETIARIHNSGPRGWEKKCSVPYWLRVKKVLDSQKKL